MSCPSSSLETCHVAALNARKNVSFHCDGVNVTAAFFDGDRQLGRPHIFTKSEAIAEGESIAVSGRYARSPFTILSSSLMNFGSWLKQYGENGC